MARTRSAQLREAARLAQLLERAGVSGPRPAAEAFSTGCAALDRTLPGGGLARGSLVEWLADQSGCGAGLLAVAAAREAQRTGGAVAVIDRGEGFYPPAAAAWGLDLTSLIVVRVTSDADQRWALDQTLRCEHVAAVLAWPRRLDGRTFRRLQLAAEASGAVGLLVRPVTARREPAWSHVRWAVAPRPTPPLAGGEAWRLAVELLRVRGGPVRRDGTGGRVELVLEIDPVSGDIHEARTGDLAAGLAPAAARPGPA
jgi:protein ImuA